MSVDAATSQILSFEDARHLVENHAEFLRPHGKQLTELLNSAGCVLAEPIVADRDFPPFPRATRDGYAVQAGDLAKGSATLHMIGEIRAGATIAESALKIGPGEAASIMTGAPVPEGADAVVMVEHTSLQGEQVVIGRSLVSGENIVPAGAEARRADLLLEPGMRLDHAAIAVAASVGRKHLLVFEKPRVAILSTGDELVDIETRPGPSQIRNSNSYSLAAQVKAAGGEPLLLPLAPDNSLRLRELIADGLEADLLLLTGGVSAGKYDLVEAVLAEFKAEFLFTGVQVQPGRPLVFGRIPPGVAPPEIAPALVSDLSWKYFFGLPGNPVSTMVTFQLFVKPVLQAMTGASPRKLIFLSAHLSREIKTRLGLKRFLPARLTGEFDQAYVELTPWQGSGDIAAQARSNCYIVIPPDRERLEAGELVSVMMR